MIDSVTVRVNGKLTTVLRGTSVAAAIATAGADAFRVAVNGERRSPVCGMGICGECRVTIDGQRHLRSCLILCREGMEVCTDV